MAYHQKKHKDEREKLAVDFFEDSSLTNNEVGEKCFNEIYRALEED